MDDLDPHGKVGSDEDKDVLAPHNVDEIGAAGAPAIGTNRLSLCFRAVMLIAVRQAAGYVRSELDRAYPALAP
jgi:hypothetical protein